MKNQDWFEQFLNDIILSLVGGMACGQLPQAKQPIEDYLEGRMLYEEISKSPQVKVTGKDSQSITFLIRGEFPFFNGAVTAFLRIEIKIAKKLIEKTGTLNIDILDWITVIGDLTLSKAKVFEARLAFGYDQRDGTGVFMGAGALKIIPAQFSLDLTLGGLDDRGAVLGLKIESPVAIPLGTSGLGLKAIGGEFAYNFVARLDYKGSPVPNPNAADYVDWASNAGPLEKWKPGPSSTTAVGVGIRTDIVTLADQGRLITLKDSGLAVLTPGPVFILGGFGEIAGGMAKVKGAMVVDIASASFALGLAAAIEVPPRNGDLIKGSGRVETFFSFQDPSLWYLYLGRVEEPISVKALRGLFGASAFYMVDNHLMQFGGALQAGWDWGWWKVRFWAIFGVEARAKIGWNPALVGAFFKLWGELGVQIWFIKLALKAYAAASGTVANPSQLMFEVGFTIDLPWPIPDIEFEKDVSFSDATIEPPILSLVLAEAEQQANTSVVTMNRLGAIHPITGRQWLLGTEKAWPDLEIVVPFHTRLIDKTVDRVVVGPVVSSQNQGGYDIHHELAEVTLKDLVSQTKVPVHGVWADSQGGSTARLHLLGQDPYAWLCPHVMPGSVISGLTQATLLQCFGHGDKENFSAERRFGEVLIKPRTAADLLTEYAPALSERVLACDWFQIRFATSDYEPIQVDQIELFIVSSERNPGVVAWGGQLLTAWKVKDLYGEIVLGAVKLPLSGRPVEWVQIQTGRKDPLLVYAVVYHEKRALVQKVPARQILKPSRYQLTVKGKSYGTHPTLPATDVLSWEFSKDFEVIYPERLRPYLHYTTLGDGRIFGPEAHPWNPTMYGTGFPQYRKYDGVLRFRVPYLDKLFTGNNGLSLRLDYDDQVTLPVEQVVNIENNNDQASSMLQASQDWITANAGAGINLLDQEMVFTQNLVTAGPVHVSLWFQLDASKIKLDEWTATISQFEDFAHHLSWTGNCVQTSYDRAGKTVRPVSRTLWTVRALFSNRNEPILAPKVIIDSLLQPGSLLGPPYPFEIVTETLPEEYAETPKGWELPAVLTDTLQALDEETGLFFGRFAHESGVRFDDGTPGSCEGLNDIVSQTTVEILNDSAGRPYALWLRTPEPVDWRRVEARLRIVHIDRIGDCPIGYSRRRPLNLKMAILPSPDGSAAFLVGNFAGTYCRLPCGEYELTLTFDPGHPGLFRLRPRAGVPSPETAVLKFMEPYGLDWPKPSPTVRLPFIEPEALLFVLWRIPELLTRAIEGPLTPEIYDLLGPILTADPQCLVSEAGRRIMAECRAAYLRASRPPGGDRNPGLEVERLRQLLAGLRPVLELARSLAEETLKRERRNHEY